MEIREENGVIKVAAPAKINLYLEILGKRQDGYHEIETVMQEISLFDFISLENSDGPVEFTCSNRALPCGEDNLVIRAVRIFQEETKILRGVKIHLEKNIPVGAGLGGGSSDAVAILMGLNRLWKTGFDRRKLLLLAERLGSDTPFFLYGNTALCKGRGEVIIPHPLHTQYHYILVYPRFEVSTSLIYKNFKIHLTKDFKDVEFFLEMVSSGNPTRVGRYMFNRLEEVTFKLYPDLARIKQSLAEYDFCGVLLSGSGSAIYGLCEEEGKAREIEKRIRNLDVGDVFLVTNVFDNNC